MTNLLVIQDDKIVIKTLVLESTSGAITHDGSLTIQESVTIAKDLQVNGSVYVDTLTVKNLNAESLSNLSAGNWSGDTESDINGKGFSWTVQGKTTQFIYRNGNRLWTNADLDLAASNSIRIDNAEVLSAGALGPTIVKSNIKELGSLRSLNVVGDSNLGDFAFFNSTHGRIGVGTNEPNTAISIVENNVEIGIGSPSNGVATIGTRSNHDMSIVTDNVARLTAKANGDIVIGDENGKTGVVRIFGSLYVDNLVADTRIERSSNLEFKTTRDASIYGKGLSWTGTGDTRLLVMRANPDRLQSSESFEVGANQCYYIDGSVVMTKNALGNEVLRSNLISVGGLESLTVHGNTQLVGEADIANIRSTKIVINDSNQNLSITDKSIDAEKALVISTSNIEALYADQNEIVIGDKTRKYRPIKVQGMLSIGINNPDPSLSFSVSGDVSIGNKRFTNGTASPTTGEFNIGDICWNQNPQVSGWVGWICVGEGTPGTWLPFGGIGIR